MILYVYIQYNTIYILHNTIYILYVYIHYIYIYIPELNCKNYVRCLTSAFLTLCGWRCVVSAS